MDTDIQKALHTSHIGEWHPDPETETQNYNKEMQNNDKKRDTTLALPLLISSTDPLTSAAKQLHSHVHTYKTHQRNLALNAATLWCSALPQHEKSRDFI